VRLRHPRQQPLGLGAAAPIEPPALEVGSGEAQLFALAMDAYAGHAGNWLEELRGNATKLLQAARATAAGAGVEADTVLLDSFKGTVHDQVIAEAEASKAELIVIGTHGRRGIGRWVMGSSAEHILRLSPGRCCWSVRPKARTRAALHAAEMGARRQ
jgi:nucleotide-binding universal stress UspA family protein